MTKLQLLHRALNERLMAAVEQIMEMVGGTVLEYEEETIRARKENEVLRRRLRWMQGANPADWPGPSEPITLSTPDESNPSQQDECAVNFGFGQESEGLVIKTETTDHPLYSATTLPQRTDQGSDIAGTSTGITYGLADSMTWDSAQSYMAPLDFDPTSGSTRVRHWRGQNRRQRMSFACPDCGKVFGREQRLMIHMRIHSTERPYKYRRRKAFFYGDTKKKRKLHGLSQLSREIVDDLSDCSEQTSRSSASPERLAPDQEEEPGGLSTESDHTSCDKEPENRTTTPVRDRRKKKTGANQIQCHCPHCPDRVFARPCQLAMHMKTHTIKALVNLPNQAQSGTDEIMDVKMKSPPKKQRKNEAVKEDKDAGKSEFHCPKCDKVFAFATKLRFHMKSHKAQKALSRKTLKMPIQTEPSKEETMEAVPKTTEGQNLQELKKTFACPHCDKVFIREGWLEPHIRSQHWKVKKRHSPCEIMLDSSRTRSQRPYYQGPECQSNSTDDLFKIHHCCYCKQPHYRMMDHLQSVHSNEPEVAKALSFDQSSQERKHLLNLLQTKGNVLHCTNVVQSSKQDLKPFSMFALDCSFDDSVYCIYCLGLFNKKSFATHLEQCKGKSFDSAENSCDEILPNAGPVPPTPTLTSPWSPEEIDANLEPSGFHYLNTTYETEQLNLYNEQGSFHQDVTCSAVQLDSSPNGGVRNDGQTEGANLQFKYSPENEVSYDFKSVNSRNPKTGQESTDCKNEEIILPICDTDQEKTMTATSDTCAIKAHQEYVLRNPYDDFSPPHNNPTVSNDSVKAQTYGTGRRRKRKRRSHVQNKSLIMDYGLLGEGEGPNSKIHVCQHCGATFCSSYTLRRHEYTHTGERPFWCHHCNVGFIQKYRLLKHTFAYHGVMSTNTDLEKLKRPKRRIQGGMKDEVSLEPSAKSPKDLPDAVNDDTEEKVAATMQDTEARGFHWEEAGTAKSKTDTDR